MGDRDRVIGYAERFFQRSGRTEWPTVRQAARARRLSQKAVEQLVEGDEDMCLSYYFVDFNVPLGDMFIDVINPPVPQGREE